jgi:hypothetical protein
MPQAALLGLPFLPGPKTMGTARARTDDFIERFLMPVLIYQKEDGQCECCNQNYDADCDA